MRLAAVVLEEHAGRAVQLRDDDALGAVDDERAVLGHERDLAHVDLLLLHLLDRLLRRLLVHDDQADARAQRRAVGQAALLALDDVERRSEQRIADELETCVARVRRDREDRRERGLQALVLALGHRRHLLQERAVARELGLQQERHRKDARALREALADALLLGKGVGSGLRGRHEVCPVSDSFGKRVPSHGAPVRVACTSARPGSGVRFTVRLSRGIAPLAWWLATTSRWRTTTPLRGRPTKPSFLQSTQKAKRSNPILGWKCFASISGTLETRRNRRAYKIGIEAAGRGSPRPAFFKPCCERGLLLTAHRSPSVRIRLSSLCRRKSSGSFANRDLRCRSG